jgi:hypothetical protein
MRDFTSLFQHAHDAIIIFWVYGSTPPTLIIESFSVGVESSRVLYVHLSLFLDQVFTHFFLDLTKIHRFHVMVKPTFIAHPLPGALLSMMLMQKIQF